MPITITISWFSSFLSFRFHPLSSFCSVKNSIMVSKAWWDLQWHLNKMRFFPLSHFLTQLHTSSMIQPSFSSDNRLSQLSSLTAFSDSSQIHKFRYAFFLKMIVKLELKAQHRSLGATRPSASHMASIDTFYVNFILCS